MKTRYTYGGTVDATPVGVGLWHKREFTYQDDDIEVTLTPYTALRPSSITYSVYGKDGLLWLLLQYNNIIDPVAELVPGKVLRLPKPSLVL